ncbi:DNA topoisomerase 3-alpha [Lutzomyia longipalpis]|uniref:DNA topoisomerase 3-alpha n=1 Tax=Lutzomyia longipalpis TaxID=7200 RepID=UPI002483E466|nr:DNA topoisomerase 3-alpha [Lutzomyia longipalpis]
MVKILTFLRKSLKLVAENAPRMKYLNVAEKNDAAKTIAGHLSRGNSRRREGLSVYNKIYEFDAVVHGQNVTMVMTSVSGHLLTHDFTGSYRSWKMCNPSQLFDAPVTKMCPEDSMKIRQTLEREVRYCTALIIWTDCDREGENIGFEIVEVCRNVKNNIRVYRAKFSEITPQAVRRALDNLVQPDERQSQAVDVRSELDLRIGAAFTRFQTMRLQSVFQGVIESLVSYGSCQIPTLGFVVQRYKEAENFVPQKFWKLRLTHTVDELTVEFTWGRNRLFDRKCCEAIFLLVKRDPPLLATVQSVVQKPKSKWRPQPMDTIELEKLGSRKLKISAKQTMQIAEKLYQQGYISYPRTETNMFSKEINLRSLVERQAEHPAWGEFARRVMDWGPNPRNGRKSDQAHPPIHPIKFTTGLSGNEQRVYELIVRHFLACVSRDATGSETVVNIEIGGEEFSASGLVIFERNYLDVYIYDRWNGKEIHHYEMGTSFEPTTIEMPEGTTTAPQMLTEADLIALMEKHSIGTDATHAEHINTIKERGYIGVVDNGFLVPGTLGMGLVEGYDAMSLSLAQPKLRAGLEADLKAICDGVKQPDAVLREQIEIYREAFRVITERAQILDEKVGLRFNSTPQQAPQITETQTLEEVFRCPRCGTSKMALKRKASGNGVYLSCMNFPQCKAVIWLDDFVKEASVSSEHCRTCGPDSKKLVLKFKQMASMMFLNCDSTEYTSCLLCDAPLRDLLGVNLDTLRQGEGSQGGNSSVRNRDVPSSGYSTDRSTGSSRNNIPPRSNNAPPRSNNVPPRNNNYPSSGYGSQRTNNPSSGSSTSCPKCSQPLKKLTVKKSGPNHGREFYVCPTPDNPCKTFIWAEDITQNDRDSPPPPRASGSRSGGGGGGASGRPRAKRKCAICRLEGHTRNNCPQHHPSNS